MLVLSTTRDRYKKEKSSNNIYPHDKDKIDYCEINCNDKIDKVRGQNHYSFESQVLDFISYVHNTQK